MGINQRSVATSHSMSGTISNWVASLLIDTYIYRVLTIPRQLLRGRNLYFRRSLDRHWRLQVSRTPTRNRSSSLLCWPGSRSQSTPSISDPLSRPHMLVCRLQSVWHNYLVFQPTSINQHVVIQLKMTPTTHLLLRCHMFGACC